MTTVDPTCERLDVHPSPFRFLIRRQSIENRVELALLPDIPLVVECLGNRLRSRERYEARKARELGGVFTARFIDHEVREVFPVVVLARGVAWRLDEGQVPQAVARPHANMQALASVVDAVPTAE
jgi:hypothetical protein